MDKHQKGHFVLIPVQVFKNVREGEIIFEYMKRQSNDRYKQTLLINELSQRYNMQAYEIKQILKQIT